MIRDAKGKNVGKTLPSSSFHYFEENDQYRIERPPVWTGGLKTKKVNSTNQFINLVKHNFGFTKKKFYWAVEKVHGALPIYTIQNNNGQVSTAAVAGCLEIRAFVSKNRSVYTQCTALGSKNSNSLASY